MLVHMLLLVPIKHEITDFENGSCTFMVQQFDLGRNTLYLFPVNEINSQHYDCIPGRRQIFSIFQEAAMPTV